MRMTHNDVLNYSKFYKGKNTPPPFFREYFDVQDKLFLPNNELPLAKKLGFDTQSDVILHYFSADSRQNRLLENPHADDSLHKNCYAVCSTDFSVDSSGCYSCFNEGNILKNRFHASWWQQQEKRVVLTLTWGDRSTYQFAFENVEKGSICAVSHRGIQNESVFREGLEHAVEKIQMDALCWYGNIPEYVQKFYDLSKIVKMQPRSQWMNQLKKQKAEWWQPSFRFAKTNFRKLLFRRKV